VEELSTEVFEGIDKLVVVPSRNLYLCEGGLWLADVQPLAVLGDGQEREDSIVTNPLADQPKLSYLVDGLTLEKSDECLLDAFFWGT